jgi:sporulation protein YlmC with PRC-barrel domain
MPSDAAIYAVRFEGQYSPHTFYQELYMTTASGHTSAIRAKKVLGTDVKDTAGNTIGKVEDIMLDKQSSNIMYAVVGFGGFLGMGEKYHPVPWSQLDYDKDDGAYVVSFTKEQLKAAPADSLDALTRDDGLAYRDRAYDYYKVKRYWQ